MASDWRFWVWEYGLMPLPDLPAIGLASRWHDSFPAGGILTNQPSTFPLRRVVYPPGTVLPDSYFITDYLPGAGNFPYGLAVDPDGHT